MKAGKGSELVEISSVLLGTNIFGDLEDPRTQVGQTGFPTQNLVGMHVQVVPDYCDLVCEVGLTQKNPQDLPSLGFIFSQIGPVAGVHS